MLRRRALLTVAMLLLAFIPTQAWSYLDCDSITVSPTDSLTFINSVGRKGDTVWVPLRLTNVNSLTAFVAYVRYDSTILTPVEDPAQPGVIWAQPEGRLATSLYYQPDAFLVLPSFNPADSGGIVVGFNSFSPDLAPDISPGSDQICTIPFLVNPATYAGTNTPIWFHQINEMAIYGTDTVIADCRRSSFAVGGGTQLVWPTTVDGSVAVTYIVAGSVTLDHVTGQHPTNPNLVDCQTSPIDIFLRITSPSDLYITGLTTGFELYSPDGAAVEIDSANTMWNPAINWTWLYWDGGVFVNRFLDGEIDTCGFGAFGLFSIGFRGSEAAWIVSADLNCQDQGKSFCLDSAFYRPGGVWFWSMGGYGALPAWDGPHCWQIGNSGLPPIVQNCPDSLVVSHCSSLLQYDFDAIDAEGDFVTYEMVSGPGTIDPTSGLYTYVPSAADVGAPIPVSIRACESSWQRCSSPCDFNIFVTNDAPTFTNNCGMTFFVVCGRFLTYQVEATSSDCDPIRYRIASISPAPVGDVSLDSLTGLFSWHGDYGDCGLASTVTIEATDGITSASCAFDIGWIGIEATGVKIEKTHGSIQGSHQSVDITNVGGTQQIGGFDFLIAYDASALTFTGATEGSIYSECGWEYFTYRYGVDGNCSGGCPSGMLRLVGIAETNNGPNHPDCYHLSSGDTYATLDFLISNDRTLECQYVPIRFYWLDCGDNALSSLSGDSLFVAWNIYDFENNLIWNEDDSVNYPESNRIPNIGVPDICFNTQPGKPSAVTLVDFWNGGIDIACADSIDARGDINLNEVPNEIADAVLFSNYFVYGIGVLSKNTAGQTAASDVNADGLTLSVSDLVYLIRIITGDALPYAKAAPIEITWRHQDGVISVDDSVGAAYVVVSGDVTPSLEATNMEMRYNFDGVNTHILIYSMERDSKMSGAILAVDAPVIDIEMATYDGAPVAARNMPEDYQLAQNYPNPFNPFTTIGFVMRESGVYSLDIYNLSGQLVFHRGGTEPAGHHEIIWDATDFASGVYFYRLTARDFVDTKKMILLK